MVYVLGLCCVAWTILELFQLAQSQPSIARVPNAAPWRGPSVRAHRTPLAAWDEQGRPIFVEDVSVRGAR